jgi:hypothetical protein
VCWWGGVVGRLSGGRAGEDLPDQVGGKG